MLHQAVLEFLDGLLNTELGSVEVMKVCSFVLGHEGVESEEELGQGMQYCVLGADIDDIGIVDGFLSNLC